VRIPSRAIGGSARVGSGVAIASRGASSSSLTRPTRKIGRSSSSSSIASSS